ncbi:integrase [Nocardioides sp. CF8]|nr:integrase [Nocardioides sp. CF8]
MVPQRVAGLRVDYAPRDPADRLEYRPGDQAQCDLWFPPVKIALGPGQRATPPVLVIVSSYSRFITAMMLPSRTTGDLLGGMWELMSSQLGAVPQRLIWDNEAGIGRRNRYAEGVTGFCGTLATRMVQFRPFDPESKGIVERANGYLETSFLPGRAFTSPADFNTQLGQWLPLANGRIVRRLGARPVERIGLDRAAMLALPPMPPATGFRARVRLPRDYYGRDRQDGRGPRGPGHGHRDLRWPRRRKPPAVLGHRPDDHRSRPRRYRTAAAPSDPGPTRRRVRRAAAGPGRLRHRIRCRPRHSRRR